MPNLFWKNVNGKTVNVVESPFKSEEEFETYIYRTEEILGDIFILKRQIRVSSGKDILDMIGIDKENNVVIIEMKNYKVDENIIPQVLRYALWAETNPDSIKALWLECKDKPEDISINWEALNVKIIIIAPSIKLNVLRTINKINYEVELLEIKKFAVDKNEFIFVNKLEPESPKGSRITKGRESYDKNFYLENYNKDSVEVFFHTIQKIEKLVKKKGWKLDKKMNKGYVGFKYGFPNVFGITWVGSKSFCIFFKLTKKLNDKLKIPGIKPYRYEEQWNQVLYKVEGKDYDINKLMHLFKASYEYITSAK
ncbi:MAG: hypothetical protein P9X22_02755 [Candidatus Zapsychrus exili]|nr:hypothetical protein [Candidatus Zapsychrus exili]